MQYYIQIDQKKFNLHLLDSLEDMATIDLYSKYLELLKAYEAVVKQREDDRKAFDQQISAMRYIECLFSIPEYICVRNACRRMVVISEGRHSERPKYAGSAMAQLEADKKHLEAKIAVLEVCA